MSTVASRNELRTLADIPRWHARERPDRVALVCGSRHVTFAELNRFANRAANGLAGEGVTAGSRIGWLDVNSDHVYEMLFACAKSRTVFCSLNWRLSADELRYIIDDAEVEILFVGRRCIDLVRKLELRTVRRIIAVDATGAGWEDYTSWRDRQDDAEPDIALSPGDSAIQIYTSGTTGRPKGVVLSSGALLGSGTEDDGEMAWNRWQRDDVGLLTMPCFHIAGLRWGVMGLIPGGTTVVMPEFDPAEVVRLIPEHRVTRMFLVPTALEFVISAAAGTQADFSSMRLLWYGASSMPLALLKDAIRVFGCQFIQSYGMTETSAQATFLPPQDHDPAGNPRMRSVGKCLPGVEVHIIDEAGKVLGPGSIGEICIRSPSNMLGYWKRESETEAVMRDGWIRSGDVGRMDEDGYVYILDRIKDMIISGGENVYPAEIENAIVGHRAVAEVAVIGVPDDTWGESVKAVVVLRPGCEATAADIIAHARRSIASYKVPKSVDFVDALPKSASGKVLKRELHTRYRDQATARARQNSAT
ncbi:MAG: fatty-acid--CoA ligase [Burkholderiales bacterium]